MQLKSIFLIMAIVAVFGVVTSSIGNKTVFAAQQEQPNAFGKGASELGKSHEMGSHASSQYEPRLGIGNVGNAVCGEKLKPGELAGFLNGGGCP
ncbi:MAG: hypothetical protein ACTHKF_03115 [Candidatus Nitrosocosmicus sp.]